MATVQEKARIWFHESKSIVTIQRIVRLEYGNCQPPSKNFMKSWNDFLEFLITTVKEDAEEQKDNERNDKNGIKSNYGQNESTHQVNKNIPSKYLDLNTAVAQGVQFFIAGFDTVSATISNVAYILALYPEIQKRTYEEIRDVLQKTEGELSYDALQEMTYLDSVLCETLRLFPAFA
ncbi:putative cytochrome P450 6a14, partial [Araneus ventricosus]